MKILKYGIRIISAIGICLMLCVLSLKTMVFISEAGVDDLSFRICSWFILVGTLYLIWLVWWYIAFGKELWEEYKSRNK